MIKRPGIVICENPMLEDGEDPRLFLLYDRKIKVYAEVYHFDIADEPAQMELKRSLDVYGTTEVDDEYFIIAPVWVIPDEKFTQAEDQKQVDTLARIMRRMADWYHAYVVWENSNLDYE